MTLHRYGYCISRSGLDLVLAALSCEPQMPTRSSRSTSDGRLQGIPASVFGRHALPVPPSCQRHDILRTTNCWSRTARRHELASKNEYLVGTVRRVFDILKVQGHSSDDMACLLSTVLQAVRAYAAFV